MNIIIIVFVRSYALGIQIENLSLYLHALKVKSKTTLCLADYNLFQVVSSGEILKHCKHTLKNFQNTSGVKSMLNFNLNHTNSMLVRQNSMYKTKLQRMWALKHTLPAHRQPTHWNVPYCWLIYYFYGRGEGIIVKPRPLIGGGKGSRGFLTGSMENGTV